MRNWLPLVLVSLLVSWGATPVAAQVRRTPAVSGKRPAVVGDVFPDPPPYVFTRQDSLLLAAATDDVPLAQRLLAHGAEANRPYRNPDTLSYLKTTLTLPDWSQVNEGENALDLAVQGGSLAMTDLLLRHGADPQRPTPQQPTVLCRALYYVPNQAALLKRLLATGLNPDSARCWKTALSLVIDYNTDMHRLREQYHRLAAPGTVRPRRSRYYQRPARRLEPPLHPLRSDSLNLRLLQLLTAAGARPTWFDLHQAIRSHEPVLARYLLTHGVGIEAREPGSGRTALHLAVQLQDSNVLPLLLAQGAGLNATDQQGLTPLHLAAAQPSPRLAVRLLAAGAAVNGYPQVAQCPDCPDGRGSTPLHEAVRTGNPAIVRLLLAAGASLNACDAGQQTPLHLAVSTYAQLYGYSDTNNDWSSPAPTGQEQVLPAEQERAQRAAARTRADDVLRLLLAAGASPNVTDLTGNTPLVTAVANSDTLRVGLLLRAGANPNALDQRGYPPLQGVAAVAVLRQMRAAGGQFGLSATAVLLNTTWREQPVPLAIAAAALADGGDLCETSTDGNTALHLAVADPHSSIGTVALYLAHGAPLEARNDAGWTPLVAAVLGQRPALVQLLLDAGARPDCDPGALTTATRLGSEALVQLLLRYGAPVNQPDRLTGDLPLPAAVQSGIGAPAIVGRLLAAGANPNVADSAGYSPLHRLIRQRQIAIQQAAAQQGDWNGLSPTELQAQEQAATWAEARLLATARLLLTHGAHPDSHNLAGESVLDTLRVTDTPACRQLLAEVEKAGPQRATGQK